MVKSCCAYGCTNRQKTGSGITFHSFPSDVELKRKWVKAIRRQGFEPSRHTVICSSHFSANDFVESSTFKRILKPNVVPSIFSGFPSYYQPPPKKSRAERRSTVLSLASEPSTSSSLPSEWVNIEEVEEEEDVEVIEVGLDGTTSMSKGTQTSPPKVDHKATQSEIKALPKEIENIQLKLYKSTRTIKSLRQKSRRKDKRILNLKDLVKSLNQKGLASDDFQDLLLSEFSGTSREIFLNCKRNQGRIKGGQRYSQELKKFALTLYYSSPRAYKFCRPILKLPHPSSLANWISNVNVAPGFLKNVFDRLEQLPQDAKDCNLIIDGMAIRKQILWSHGDNKFVGYCDFGDAQLEGHDVPATEALVFMLVGLKSKWKWPVGYFLQNKSSATVQSSLIKSTIHLSKQAGLKLHGVTFDGTSTNLATLNSLGCNFYGNLDNLSPEFMFNGEKYCAIPDPCHMLKLARNCLATLGKIKSPQGIIDWSFIMKLHTLQNSIGLKFANKLSRQHIEWSLNKMKVKLAAQTLSTSIANALEFLNKEGIAGFEGSEETVKFIRMIDRLFDFLNSRNPFQKGSKSAITLLNHESLSTEMMSIVEYLFSLTTLNNTPLHHSNRKTFIIGFGAAVKSVLFVSKTLLNDGDKFKYVLTYKFSQDHLETFFSQIRQRHGFNNNPNVLQFKWAIRQILLKNEISASALGNSLFSDSDPSGSIFEINWKKKKVEESLEEIEEEGEEELDIDFPTNENLMLKDNILYYICGFIVRKIIDKIPCLDCKASLVLNKNDNNEEDYARLVNMKDLGGLVYRALVSHTRKFASLLSYGKGGEFVIYSFYIYAKYVAYGNSHGHGNTVHHHHVLNLIGEEDQKSGPYKKLK
ncbi:hypothetical protein M8J75_004328 [Diaphorina citri]|nr:hypothetical protein M8J75_004328 [Diaphorina citri]